MSTESFNCTLLSLTSHYLQVTSVKPHQLRYSTERQLQREASYLQDMTELYHGVEMTRGIFVISYKGTSEDEWQYAVKDNESPLQTSSGKST